MSWEYIGSLTSGNLPDDRAWILTTLQMGILYLERVCGEPPAGCELGIMWQEHELGDYPSIGLTWDFNETMRMFPPEEYIARCQYALEIFDQAVDWSEIEPAAIAGKFRQEFPDAAQDGSQDLNEI